jgi:hypothetical protein
LDARAALRVDGSAAVEEMGEEFEHVEGECLYNTVASTTSAIPPGDLSCPR